jgi:hypothetical protein
VTDEGCLFARAGSPAAGAAEALAWLWRLGPVLDDASPSAVGVGTVEEAPDLQPLVDSGGLRGLVLFAPKPGPRNGPVPARRRARGIARFGPGVSLVAELTVFEEGEPASRSSAGAHAVRGGRTLALAADPVSAWSELRSFWSLDALAAFLAEILERPLVMLPPVGCVRLDDVPGTAQHQVEGTDRPDGRQRRRVEALRRAYAAAGARLNVAVPARGLEDGEQVPLEGVWPRSVAALAAGVGEGAFEPVCHGYLHLDPDELAAGRVEYREFRSLDEAEAGRRLDEALAWQEAVLGRRTATFVAPAWSYSPGALSAAAARGLPAWQRPALGPLLTGGVVRETVHSGLRGLHGLDYGPLAALAAHGLPPTAVLHGGLFDLRVSQLRERRDVASFTRLALRRDIVRLPRMTAVRWIGAGTLVRLLEAHETVEVRGADVHLGEAREAMLWRPGSAGATPARAAPSGTSGTVATIRRRS